MSRFDQLIAEMVKRGGDAVVLSSQRPIHLLAEGSLRPLSPHVTTTDQIVGLLCEASPRAQALRGDGQLQFEYGVAGRAPTRVSAERNADFVWARIEVIKAPPPPPSAPKPESGLSPCIFDGLDLELNPAPEAGQPLELDLNPGGAASAGSWGGRGPGSAGFAAAGGGSTLDVGGAFEAGAFEEGAALEEVGPLEAAETVEDAPPTLSGELALEAPPRLEGLAFESRKPRAEEGFIEFQPDGEEPPVVPSAELVALLRALVEQGGSDLHLSAGTPARIRLAGSLVPMGSDLLSPEQVQAFFESVLDRGQKQRFRQELALDFSLEINGLGRLRANAYQQRRGMNLVFRAVPARIPTLSELGLPASVEKLTTYPNGLILVTGPAGCGKSTTQAAIIDRINETWHDHIITVEDPIEFVHKPKHCLINQREVGTHVRSFAEALRSALREDPDVILVGELRDLETIQLAITAAETGHLVLGTLHTIDSARTIDRLIDVFPGSQKLQIRSMVSESLRGIISQRLLPSAEGKGRVAAFEILLTDRSVANLIREGKTFQIPNILRTGKARGMCAMDDAIIDLVKAKRITPQCALENMERPDALEKQLGANPRRPAGPGQNPRPGAAAGAGR